MGRRASGEGSIYRRKSDGKWVGAIHLGYADGKRHRRVVYGTTQREVREKLSRVRTDFEHRELGRQPAVFSDYLDRWLGAVKPTVAGTTWSSYESLLRVHVRPRLGTRRLDALATLEIQELLAEKSAEGLAPRTVQMIHAVLRRALEDAVRWGLASHNVAADVRRPRVPRREPNPFSPEEVTEILRAASQERLGPLVVLALTSGLRLGELLALRWQDLDFASGTLSVRRTRRRDGTVADPKSHAGWRDVDLPERVVELLAQHRHDQQLQVGAPAAEDGCEVFTTQRGGPLAHRHVQRVWDRIVERAGVNPRGFHHLRKTYASWLVAANVDVRTAQTLLGHADVRMTLEVYSRSSRAARQGAAESIAAALPPAAAS